MKSDPIALLAQSQAALNCALDELSRSLEINRQTIASLNIALDAIATMGTWGNPYAPEAVDALTRINETLSGAIPREKKPKGTTN